MDEGQLVSRSFCHVRMRKQDIEVVTGREYMLIFINMQIHTVINLLKL